MMGGRSHALSRHGVEQLELRVALLRVELWMPPSTAGAPSLLSSAAPSSAPTLGLATRCVQFRLGSSAWTPTFIARRQRCSFLDGRRRPPPICVKLQYTRV
jgi:hypothetical protein